MAFKSVRFGLDGRFLLAATVNQQYVGNFLPHWV
jgi:hypothetical protein